MADSPKGPRTTARAKAGSTTMSAAEALMAAEAAIGAEPARKKPAPRKAASANPVKEAPEGALKPVETNPQSEPAPKPAEPPAPLPPPPVPAAPASSMIKSPTEMAATASTQPLPPIEGTKMMNDVMETGKKFAEDAKAKFETAYSDFNDKAKAHVEKSTKAVEEMSDMAKGNMEAMVESGKIAAKGMEMMGQEAVDFTRKNFEKATASFKSLATAKTPTEFFQLQSQLFSSSFDDFTKEAAKNSEAMMKLAGDVAQPLTARMSLVTDKVKSIAA
ncbi:phasin family protein [Sphingobium sp. 10 DY56-G10]|uniref:phasin family protein n=1 Tax=Sphingomonadales TaxID=204457 RepID=UPI00056CA047|nr:phasin family protein [Sphingomonas sp. SKA58]